MEKNNQKPGRRGRDNPVPPEKKTQIIQDLLTCGQFLHRQINQIFQGFGLKQQQFSVLDEVVWHGPLTQKELCERLFFEKSNTSKIVRILLEKNLIAIALAPEDRRLTLISETPQGVALWKDCMQALNASSTRLLDLLSDEEVGNTRKTLKKIQKKFEKR